METIGAGQQWDRNEDHKLYIVLGQSSVISSSDKEPSLYLQVYLTGAVLSQPLETKKTCQYKNNGETYQINEGEVTEIKKTKVRVCVNGKTILKKKEEYPPPYKFGCDGNVCMIPNNTTLIITSPGCTVEGKIVCKGTIVRVRIDGEKKRLSLSYSGSLQMVVHGPV